MSAFLGEKSECLHSCYIFIERLWRTVKYEDLYLHDYETVSALRRGLTEYLKFYCYERRHQALGRQTPWEVYREVLSAKERQQRERLWM